MKQGSANAFLTSLVIFGNSVFAQTHSDSPQVVWRDSANQVDICLQDIRVFSERANVCYSVFTKRKHEGLKIGYLDRSGYDTLPRWVEIRDDNLDGQADRVLVYNFQYKRGWLRSEEIFRKADELLARFRKELKVQKIVDEGPFYPDPFVVPTH